MELKFRKKILPKNLNDFVSCFVLFIGIPLTYLTGVKYLLPAIHDSESFMLKISNAMAFFLLLNLSTNWIFCIVTDTSNNDIEPPLDLAELSSWRFCSDCKKHEPPRSWHCKICQSCILKRDHHCMYTGCCIGHWNHRYFLMLLVYMTYSSTYVTVLTFKYIWSYKYDEFFNLNTIFKLFCPVSMFVLDSASVNFTIIVCILNILAILQSWNLLIYHFKLVLRGAVGYERRDPKYSLGWRKNLEVVLGERWYLTWISPFIPSKLPTDGAQWQIQKLK